MTNEENDSEIRNIQNYRNYIDILESICVNAAESVIYRETEYCKNNLYGTKIEKNGQKTEPSAQIIRDSIVNSILLLQKIEGACNREILNVANNLTIDTIDTLKKANLVIDNMRTRVKHMNSDVEFITASALIWNTSETDIIFNNFVDVNNQPRLEIMVSKEIFKGKDSVRSIDILCNLNFLKEQEKYLSLTENGKRYIEDRRKTYLSIKERVFRIARSTSAKSILFLLAFIAGKLSDSIVDRLFEMTVSHL